MINTAGEDFFYSGGHFNPAVTLGVTLSGGCSIVASIFYFFSQILGGMVGAACALVRIIHTNVPFGGIYLSLRCEMNYVNIVNTW